MRRANREAEADRLWQTQYHEAQRKRIEAGRRRMESETEDGGPDYAHMSEDEFLTRLLYPKTS